MVAWTTQEQPSITKVQFARHVLICLASVGDLIIGGPRMGGINQKILYILFKLEGQTQRTPLLAAVEQRCSKPSIVFFCHLFQSCNFHSLVATTLLGGGHRY